MPLTFAFPLTAWLFAAPFGIDQASPPPQNLAALVEAYALVGDGLLTIMLRGDSLVIETGLGARTPLTQLPDGDFRPSSKPDLLVRFTRDNGQDVRVRVTHPDGILEGQRVVVPTSELME